MTFPYGPVWSKTLHGLSVNASTIAKHQEHCPRTTAATKSYNFFCESYIHDVYVALMNGEWLVKGRCHRSQRKNETAHNIKLRFETRGSTSCDVSSSSCSCAAGYVLLPLSSILYDVV